VSSRGLIITLLLGAAVLEIARCGVAVASDRPAGPTAGLVVTSLAAAGLSLWAAYACEGRRRWPIWAALLIGAASGPQAAVSGFRSPYTVLDAATAVLGIVLAVTVLTTAGRTGSPAPSPESSCLSVEQPDSTKRLSS
jgi:hypothetical protein